MKTQINNPFALRFLMERYGHTRVHGVVYINWTDSKGRFMFLAS